MDSKHYEVSDLNLYVHCPKYYEFYKAGPFVTKKQMYAENIRRIFNWIFLQNDAGHTDISIEDLKPKILEIFPDSDPENMASRIYTIYSKLNRLIGKYSVKTAGLMYPVTIDNASVIVTIDAIVSIVDRPYTWLIILDFSDRTISDQAILQVPNIILPKLVLYEQFEIPAQQLQVALIRYNMDRVMKISNAINEIENFSRIVYSIKNNIYYRRIGYQCQNCSFIKQCFG